MLKEAYYESFSSLWCSLPQICANEGKLSPKAAPFWCSGCGEFGWRKEGAFTPPTVIKERSSVRFEGWQGEKEQGASPEALLLEFLCHEEQKRQFCRGVRGSLVTLPHEKERVYYFPQGHMEQVQWDEPSCIRRPDRVSPWELEPLLAAAPPTFQPVQRNKRTRSTAAPAIASDLTPAFGIGFPHIFIL
ncbi:hypothetical protein BHE74_00028741 [Ensete ventricosum]|nr:hypothetical protein BHE74_00028741 [Ensete ventricosum]